MKASATPLVVPKLEPLGGSSGKAGRAEGQTLSAFASTLQIFQKVHRASEGAPGIFDVSA